MASENPFTDIKPLDLGQPEFVQSFMRHPNYKGFELGG